MSTGVVLLSGGLDSGVSAALFVRQGGTLAQAVFCDYGQRAAAREWELSQRFAQRLGVGWRCVELPWLHELARQSGCALADPQQSLPRGTKQQPGDAQSAAKVWVPARNAVFLAIGAAFAETLGADAVVAGFNREEAATFPDNSAAFLAAAGAYFAQGTRSGVSVVSPTLAMDKRAIVRAARELGFSRGDFWSCYEGYQQPCGRCESCLRGQAWDEAE